MYMTIMYDMTLVPLECSGRTWNNLKRKGLIMVTTKFCVKIPFYIRSIKGGSYEEAKILVTDSQILKTTQNADSYTSAVGNSKSM